MENKLEQLHWKLCLTGVLIKALKNPVFQAFQKYCEAANKTEKYLAYGKFVAEIYKGGGCLTALVRKHVFEDENVYIKTMARGGEIDDCVAQALARELRVFSEFAALTAEDFSRELGENDLPTFRAEKADLQAEYAERVKNLSRYGYGIFSSHGMFRLSDERKIEPILSADKTDMGVFIGYEAERGKVVENTLAFVEGRPAANTLLCGDAGTGKSSTVKAVANEFFSRGVRLIELRKDQLSLLPYVMGKISENPLKFIIFIDDLSFNQNDDNFSMLKAALEGSASARADNAVIYATSNRRHIIKESFGDRDGDDVHRNDTLQETLSLSERFGLTVLFQKPDKKLYLSIVKELAKRKGVTMDETELEVQAEAFALKKGNRSARAAEQFIDSLL